MANVRSISDADFEEKVLKAERPVLVDFSAAWCGPCRMLAPVIEQVAAELADSVDVYTIDVDQSPEVSAKYQIMSVPTLIVFSGGEEKSRTAGYMPKPKVLDFVRESS